jgi:hypothetical protein
VKALGENGLEPIHLKTGRTSVDRLSLTGCPDSLLEATLKRYSDLIKSNRPGRYPDRYLWQTQSGAIIRELEPEVGAERHLQDDDQWAEDSLVPKYAREAPSSGSMRYGVDFNPNTIFPEERDMLFDVIGCFKPGTISLTRVDIAVDYQGHNLGDYNVAYVGSRPRSQTIHQGRSGKLETKYIGAPGSDIRIRIYDKAVEQKQEGDWWRVEAQCRRWGKRIIDNPFAGMLLYRNKMPVDDWETRARVEYYLNHPERHHELNQRQRKRLKELSVSETENLKPSPQEMFAMDSDQLITEGIGSWIVWTDYCGTSTIIPRKNIA